MVGNIRGLYFEWMSKLAIPNNREREKYSDLLNALDEIIFYFTIPLDENRMIDGINLRYRFGEENHFSIDIIEQEIDIRECSVLEMMLALALRGEESIMEDCEIGSQLTTWFKEMIFSLKLQDMVDENFDPSWVEYRIDCLLNHAYEPDGDGGLFTIKNPRADMRNVEIWYQMCWYLDVVLQN